MLVVPITNLQDQETAERLREIARHRQCSHALTEAAVDEAMLAYKASNGRFTVAMTAMLVFLAEAQHGSVVRAIEATTPAHEDDAIAPDRRPFAWVESWPAIAVGALIVGALLAARVAGWLQ